MVLVEGGGFRGRDFRAVGASAQEAVVSSVDCQVGLGSTSALETGRMLENFFPSPRVIFLLLVPHWLLATPVAFSWT